MELLRWLGEQAQKSKSVAFAFVVAALLIIGGPRFAPDLVAGLPSEWAWAPWLVLAFCGGLLVLSLVASGWRMLRRAVQFCRRRWSARGPLDREEVRFLITLGDLSGHTMNIGNLTVAQTGLHPLALKEVADKLTARGLIDRHSWDSDVCSLTDLGRQHTLKLRREFDAARPRPLGKGDWVRHRDSGRKMRVIEAIQQLGPTVLGGSLPVTCEWREPDGQIARSPFHPAALERIDVPTGPSTDAD